MKAHANNLEHGAGLRTDTILTKAETRIACGYVDGMIGKEIADACDISYNTVIRHTQNIYDKTGIPRSTNALVAWFLSKNLDIDLDEFRRRVGAFLLLCLVSFQIASTDFDSQFIRRAPSRRVEARKGNGRRGRREEDGTIDLLTAV